MTLETELIEAVESNDQAGIQALIAAKAPVGDLLISTLEDAQQASEQLEMLQFLLNSKVDLNKSYFGLPLLHRAVVDQNETAIHALLQAKADLNAVDESQITPLNYAVIDQAIPIFLILLQAKANITQNNDEGSGLLSCAIDSEMPAMVGILLQAKANINRIKACYTPLARAVNHGCQQDTVALLLSSHATVNQRYGDDNTTVFHDVAFCDTNDQDDMYNRFNICQQLLLAKAEVDVRNTNNDTPLMTAASQGFESVVGILLDSKADPNLQDNQGDTAAHEIVYAGGSRKSVLRRLSMLVAAKADLTIPNNNKKTALDLAIINEEDRNFLLSI